MSPLFAPLVSIFDDVLKKIVPDVNARKEMAHELATKSADQAQELMLAQLAINKEEAKSDRWWKAGWRPFIGWCGGLAIFNNYIIMPYVPEAVPMELGQLMPIIIGMLGLGAYRSYEKKEGVN